MSEAQENTPNPRNRIKMTTNAILGIATVTIGITVFADRIIPTTDNVRVNGDVVSITPQVSGQVSQVAIQANAATKKGQTLLEVTATEYEIAVKKAETNVKLAGQQVGAHMAGVLSAQAKVTTALVAQDNVRRQGERVLTMAEKGIVSKSDADKARAAISQADAEVINVKANLERAKTQAGGDGDDNAQIQIALLELQQAQLDLENTRIKAPANGAVTNFYLSEGTYASVGKPIMTFVGSDELWLEANFRENSLGNIKPGDEIEVTLDFAPGKVFKGSVSSVDLGVSWGQTKTPGMLATVKPQNGWLRDAQSMPVTIQLDDAETLDYMRIGGQGDVVVYTNDNTIMNMLGMAWIRLVSWFSYVR
ncbi:HlyD family secretion protein [Vibrio cyclitrophicus]|nr:HlyD family secretion protein [Vibrio cyclitrophicus]UPR53075.1 HlyD family secretion protein [Vibrio cyclitrophicus]